MIKFFRQNPEIYKEFSNTLALPISNPRYATLGEFDEIPAFAVQVKGSVELSESLLKHIRFKFPITIQGYEISLAEYYAGDESNDASLFFFVEEAGENVLEQPIDIDSAQLDFLN